MAKLSNINGKFAVEDTGAIRFSDQTGTTGQILKSNGNSAPTWVDPNTVGTGPWLPLAGGVVSGPTTFQSSLTVGGLLTGANATFNGLMKLDAGGILQFAANTATPSMGVAIHRSAADTLNFVTASTNRLTINGSGTVDITATVSDAVFLRSSQATTTNVYITNTNATSNNTANLYFAPANNIAGSYIQSTAIEDFSSSANRTSDLRFAVRKDGTFNEAVIIDSSGNVGIGVTPFAHTLSTSASLDLKGNGGIWGYAGATYVNSNAYYDSGWKYKTTAPAAVLQVGGSSQELTFRQAVSGTAGNAITYTQPFTIDTSGKVGIGTTSPTARFNVKASGSTVDQIAVTHSGNTVEIAQLGQSANGNSAGALLLKTNGGTDKIYLDAAGTSYFNGGNVGINATDPVKTLDVRGSLAISNSTGSYWYMDRNDTTGNFDLNENVNGTLFTVTPNGNVGIGTTAIPSDLYTASGGGWKVLQIGQSSQIAAYGTDDEIAICQNTYLNSSGVFQAITSNVAGSSIILVDGKIYFKNASTSGTAQTTSTSMFIDTTGNVTVNEGNLFLGVTSSKQGTAYFWSNANDSRMSIANTGSAFELRATYLSTAGYKPIDFYTSDSLSMRITSGGQIEFAATYNNTTASAANMHISSAGGQIFRSTSSLKYKTDVRDYDKGLNEVMQLQPKYYKGKDDGDTQFAGLIVEDVNDLGLTEFVQYAEDGTPDALAYTHMVALLVKSIQELKADNDILKARIKILENK